MRGKLIVFEGLDKAGKSTQCTRLVENLEKDNVAVKYIRFPGRTHDRDVTSDLTDYLSDRTTPIGKMIDSYLRSQSNQEDHVIHLLFSANRWELA